MSDRESARYSYEGIDRILHEKARLGIMASLSAHREGLSFSDLKQLCDLSDGNLSRHISVLEEAGFVEVDKSFLGKRPLTFCTMTAKGMQEFADYISVLEAVVKDATTSVFKKSSPKPKPA